MTIEQKRERLAVLESKAKTIASQFDDTEDFWEKLRLAQHAAALDAEIGAVQATPTEPTFEAGPMRVYQVLCADQFDPPPVARLHVVDVDAARGIITVE